MTHLKKVLVGSALALFLFAPIVSARPPRVVIGGGFGYWGPGWYGYYGPYPYYGPYGYAPASYPGQVKIDDAKHIKDASVYVDGGYVGLAGELKKFPLVPGTHNIELRDPSGNTIYQQKIQVLAGRTTDIHAS